MSTAEPNVVGSLGGVTFHNPGAFWFAVVASSVGVLLHLPMYIGGRDMGYRLAGMPVDAPMIIGMFLITAGLVAALYGLYPPSAATTAGRVSRIRVRALDDAPMRPAHVGLLIVMAIAVTIDVMKPTTLAFVVPGMAQEYGLRSPLNPGGTVPVALLPLSGITGTVLGSFLWGWLGDRIGRRASIMLAGIIFISTSICGVHARLYLELRDVLHHGARRRRHASDRVRADGRDHPRPPPRLGDGADRRRHRGRLHHH